MNRDVIAAKIRAISAKAAGRPVRLPKAERPPTASSLRVPARVKDAPGVRVEPVKGDPHGYQRMSSAMPRGMVKARNGARARAIDEERARQQSVFSAAMTARVIRGDIGTEAMRANVIRTYRAKDPASLPATIRSALKETQHVRT